MSNIDKQLSRRAVLRAGLGVLGTGAFAAFLSACGNATTPTTAPAASTAPGSAAPSTAASSSAAAPSSSGAAATRPAGSAAASTAPSASGSGAPAGAAPGSTAAAQGTPVGVSSSKGAKNPNATKVQWWHAMGGANGTAIANLTDKFNDSQSDIYVDAIYQGNYDDTLNKFKAGLAAKQGPHIMQVYDIGQRFMIDSKAIEPIQSLIDADKFDTSQFEQAILNYYTTDKKLYAMPFNTSTPMLYYNKKAFTEAGLDPANPPKTWEDVQTTAAKLVKKDSGGKVTQYGVAFAIYGWFFEQYLATQNALYANNDNGRGATRADKVIYNSEAGVKILDWWKGMIDQGIATNLGRSTSDAQKAFTGGQIAMTIESTATLRGLVSNVGDKFEIGTGYLPRPAATLDQGGVIMGGGSNYILKDKADKEKQAAWKFVQWLALPEQQAFWHVNTGYFPMRKDVYDLPLEVENAKKYPQFATAVNQLHDTKLTPATTGAILGVFPQARASTETAMEETFLGKSAAKAALDKSVNDINQALELYNSSVK